MVQTTINKRFDAHLGVHGISFSEFIIMFHLSIAPQQKLRRIDLAGRVGLTASGITRLLAPMEKIGLIEKETNQRDARVSLVRLSNTGTKILGEASLTLEHAATSILQNADNESLEALHRLLNNLGATIE
ncbi:MAG: MarR family transcriptional regulator [Calditrichaeota bacterium]|nr:MAG: MarR family transcriptional regulator [Calditrichota bacterium]MBL1206496.1 MarR family transcriptional regulator [Calditrichota bacterium]NOG46323.1 winged helix-turn-helix transcriptional regulator [Calditrichota bacterium]